MLTALPARAADDTPAPPHPLCRDDTRLTVVDWPLAYRGLRDALADDARARHTTRLAALVDGGDEGDGERCAWNRFVFADFALYFGLVDDAFGDASPIDVARARDRLLDLVLDHVVRGDDDGFAEWSDEDLSKDDVERFLARGSAQFAPVERLVALVHRAPEAEAGDTRAMARLVAHRALSARTPFSSVFTKVALVRAGTRSVRRGLSCLARAVDEARCDEGLVDVARACAADDEALAIELLGVFASQRMYLVRDLAAFVRQSARDDEDARRDAARTIEALADGARAHARIETRGLRCGARGLFPSEAGLDEGVSAKPHHFYAVAHLALTLRRLGHRDDDALEAALDEARRYKEAIRAPGVVYNVLLGRPVLAGTAGDTARILDEQRAGARYGLARAAALTDAGSLRAPLVARRVALPRALARRVTDMRFDPARSSALLVTVRESSARPAFGLPLTASREIVWRVDLGPGTRDALLARGLPLPHVALDDDALVVRY